MCQGWEVLAGCGARLFAGCFVGRLRSRILAVSGLKMSNFLDRGLRATDLGKEGGTFQLNLAGSATLSLWLCFKPTTLQSHSFDLVFQLLGSDSSLPGSSGPSISFLPLVLSPPPPQPSFPLVSASLPSPSFLLAPTTAPLSRFFSALRKFLAVGVHDRRRMRV